MVRGQGTKGSDDKGCMRNLAMFVVEAMDRGARREALATGLMYAGEANAGTYLGVWVQMTLAVVIVDLNLTLQDRICRRLEALGAHHHPQVQTPMDVLGTDITFEYLRMRVERYSRERKWGKFKDVHGS